MVDVKLHENLEEEKGVIEIYSKHQSSENLHLIKMNYQNYENETLQIKLIEVEENDSKLNN